MAWLEIVRAQIPKGKRQEDSKRRRNPPTARNEKPCYQPPSVETTHQEPSMTPQLALTCNHPHPLHLYNSTATDTETGITDPAYPNAGELPWRGWREKRLCDPQNQFACANRCGHLLHTQSLGAKDKQQHSHAGMDHRSTLPRGKQEVLVVTNKTCWPPPPRRSSKRSKLRSPHQQADP